jgi:hypothetical protein
MTRRNGWERARRSGKSHHNGNGAGVAADPTLTGVWVPKNALRLAFHCSPEGRRLCRPALAPVPVPSGAGYGPKTFPLPPGGSAVGFVVRLLMVRRCGAPPFYRSRPANPACRLRALAASAVWKLRHPKTPWLSSLHRAASRRRVERGSKISSSFRVLPRPSEEPIPALDDLRMRLRAESGKSEPADLSTFGDNASGQEWITQRFAEKGGDYPLWRQGTCQITPFHPLRLFPQRLVAIRDLADRPSIGSLGVS